MKTTTLVIDLDGVICEEKPTFERSLALPVPGAVSTLKALKNTYGYKIIIYTARSWSEYEMTKAWLCKEEVPHDLLVMGKPVGDYWIDDRAIKFTSWKEVMENFLE